MFHYNAVLQVCVYVCVFWARLVKRVPADGRWDGIAVELQGTVFSSILWFSLFSCVCDGSFYHRLNLLSNLHCSFLFRVTFQTAFSRKVVVVVCIAVIIRRRKQSEPKLTEIPNSGWRIPESSKFHCFTFEVMFRDAGTSLRNSLRPIWAISSESRRVWDDVVFRFVHNNF